MTLINKVDQFKADADLAHQIVNGDATTVVMTEGGPVRSMAKLIADADLASQQATQQAITEFENAGGVLTTEARAYRNEAEAFRNEAGNSASAAEQSAQEAAGAAASAAQIVYGNLIMHPNRIDESISIPDGYNAFFIDPVEFGPNVTVTGLGNSTLRGV